MGVPDGCTCAWCDVLEDCGFGSVYSYLSCSCIECKAACNQVRTFWDTSLCSCICGTGNTCVGNAIFNETSCGCECSLVAQDCQEHEKLDQEACSCVPDIETSTTKLGRTTMFTSTVKPRSVHSSESDSSEEDEECFWSSAHKFIRKGKRLVMTFFY